MRVELSYLQSGKLLACSAAPREHPHGSTYPLAVTDRAADPCSLSDRPALRSPPAPVLAAASPSPCRRPGPLRRVSSRCHRLSTCHLSRRHSFRSIPCCAGRQQRRAAQAASQVWQSACGTKRPAAASGTSSSSQHSGSEGDSESSESDSQRGKSQSSKAAATGDAWNWTQPRREALAEVLATLQAERTECEDTDWKQALQPLADNDEGTAAAESVLHALCKQHPRQFAESCVLTVAKLNKALTQLRVEKNVSANGASHTQAAACVLLALLHGQGGCCEDC